MFHFVLYLKIKQPKLRNLRLKKKKKDKIIP